MQRTTSILALALIAGAASAQSMNIDINGGAGAGAGVPAANFGGPAGQPGYWTAVGALSPATVPLAALDGAPVLATLSRATNGLFVATNNANTSGDREKLMDDYQTITGGTMIFTFNDLENGTYVVYTTAASPGSSSNRGTVNIPSIALYSQDTQYTGGDIPAVGYIPGYTHAVHTVDVTDGHMTVNIADNFSGAGIISGIQLVKLPNSNARRRIYVNDNAAGTSDGGSWANAYTDVQNGLAAAELGGGPHFEVWVAQGFYRPTTGTDRNATFRVSSGLELIGGFVGTEFTLAQRTLPGFYATYLTGSIGAATITDDSYTVVTLDNVNSNTLVDGFYVVRGYNNGGTYAGQGGGMVCDFASSPQIRNCSFSGNSAGLGGGGLYTYRSSVLVSNCLFYNNDAFNGSGGAIECDGPIATTLTLQNCRFLGNYALGDAGAIHTSFVHADITNCLFSGNTTAHEGGAIKASGDSQLLRMWNCTLAGNSAAYTSGGVYANGGLDVQMHNTILWGNTGAQGSTVSGQQITTSGSSVLTGQYNTIQGQHADPRLVDADGPDNIPGNFDDNCRLQQSSPCIDAGNSSVLPLDQGDVDGDGVWNEQIPLDLDSDPRRVEILSIANTGPGGSPVVDRGCYEFQLGQVCYANCDNSGTPPVLNVADFSCFLNKFAAADEYANCDASTTVPTLNVADFACFLNKFAAGCP